MAIFTDNILFSFLKAGLVSSNELDGFVSSTFTPSGDTVELSGEPSVNGNYQIVHRKNNGGELLVVTVAGSDLCKAMTQQSELFGGMTGFYRDDTKEGMSTNLLLKSGGIVKAGLPTSADNQEFTIRGNFIKATT